MSLFGPKVKEIYHNFILSGFSIYSLSVKVTDIWYDVIQFSKSVSMCTLTSVSHKHLQTST